MYELLEPNHRTQWWAKFKTKKLLVVLIFIIIVSLFLFMNENPMKPDFYTKMSHSTKLWLSEESVKKVTTSTPSTTTTTAASSTTPFTSFSNLSVPYRLDKVEFDINSSDVMVFLHIQKTGGTTFGQHLVKDLMLRKDCYKENYKLKRFNCFRPNSTNETWLFSRYTTGWKCGLHADWTSLNECVHDYFYDVHEERNYYYFTILREPVSRYLSEYAHVNRGATWKTAFLNCNNKQYPTPLCFKGENWMGVTLKDFMACKKNWAINRQTRMLADLTAINCTGEGMSPDERDRAMLETAKENLLDMAYFGLTEEQEKSRLMFEFVFDMNFKFQFENNNRTRASQILSDTPEIIDKIRTINHLDAELYKFAREIFDQRWNNLIERGLVPNR